MSLQLFLLETVFLPEYFDAVSLLLVGDVNNTEALWLNTESSEVFFYILTK